MRALSQQYKESGDEEEVAGAYRFAALGAAEVRGARADLSKLKPLPTIRRAARWPICTPPSTACGACWART